MRGSGDPLRDRRARSLDQRGRGSERRARSGSSRTIGTRTIGSYVEPYDPHSARRVGAAIISFFGIGLFVGTLLVPVPDGLFVTVAYICPAVLLASAVLLLTTNAFVTPAMFGFSLVGVALILTLNLVTKDDSAGGQVAFCAPVMFAGSQLRPVGALLTLAASLAAEVVLLIELKPLDEAVTDIVYVGVTLVAIGVLLILSARRQNALLTQLEHQAAIDPLTGLVTRRVLDDAVQTALRSAGSSAGTAMVLIDIDHFKTVNDTYGHPVGDDALIHIAGTLRSLVRQDAVVSRLGGDEIAVLLPGCDLGTAAAGAQAFVDGVRRRPLAVHGKPPLHLSISAGIGYATRNGLGLRQLYAAADASLYDAKRAGRGRVGRPNLGPVQAHDGIGVQRDGVPQPPAQHREREPGEHRAR